MRPHRDAELINQRVAGVLRGGLRRGPGARADRAPYAPDPAAGAARRGRLPAGQQGVLAAVRPVAAAAGGAGPAAVARRADLDGRRGVLLRLRLALPRRLDGVRRRAGSPTGSTGSRSWCGWPRSSTSPSSWCATSCSPGATRCAPTASPTTPPSRATRRLVEVRACEPRNLWSPPVAGLPAGVAAPKPSGASRLPPDPSTVAATPAVRPSARLVPPPAPASLRPAGGSPARRSLARPPARSTPSPTRVACARLVAAAVRRASAPSRWLRCPSP